VFHLYNLFHASFEFFMTFRLDDPMARTNITYCFP